MGNNGWLEDLCLVLNCQKQKTFEIKAFYSCFTNQYNNLKDSKDELHLDLTGSKAHTNSPTGMDIKG